MSVLNFLRRRPYVSAGVVLAIGMAIMLVLAARDVGLRPSQFAFLVVATVVLAGLCAWIMSWDTSSDA